jgi:hypothetical protein
VPTSEHFARVLGAVQGICASKGVYLATHIGQQSRVAQQLSLKTVRFDAIQLGIQCAHLLTKYSDSGR